MADWAGHDGTATAQRYLQMARRQLDSSPTYRRLCLAVADDPALLELLDTLPPPKRQPNLLLGVVRHLDGPVGSYPAFRDFVLGRWAEVSAAMRVRSTQTNEPRRCATLLPALAAIDGPLALFEVGAAAGLCLFPDRYAYRYGDRPQLGASPVVFPCAVSGAVPVPSRLPQVVWRGGLDLNPLDVRDEDDVRWLRSLIWPEHADRFALNTAAVSIARADPPAIVRGDLTVDLLEAVRPAPADATLVVFHSAVLAYLDDAGRAAFRAQLRELARQRPTVWIANEGPGIVVDLPAAEARTRFVLSRDGAALALTDPHGASISWL